MTEINFLKSESKSVWKNYRVQFLVLFNFVLAVCLVVTFSDTGDFISKTDYKKQSNSNTGIQNKELDALRTKFNKQSQLFNQLDQIQRHNQMLWTNLNSIGRLLPAKQGLTELALSRTGVSLNIDSQDLDNLKSFIVSQELANIVLSPRLTFISNNKELYKVKVEFNFSETSE